MRISVGGGAGSVKQIPFGKDRKKSNGVRDAAA